MFLKEYEGGALFAKYGIRVPAGILLDGVILDDKEKLKEAVFAFAEGENGGFAVKAQILKGGRGKSGLILFAENEDLFDKVEELKMRLDEGAGGANKETEILVQERVSIDKEFYLAVVVDRHNKCAKVIFSSHGGVDVEDNVGIQKESGASKERSSFEAENNNVGGVCTSVLQGGGQSASHASMLQSEGQSASHTSKELRTFEVENNNVGGGRGVEVETNDVVEGVVEKLVELFVKEDAVLAEINPLALTHDGEFIALDSKVILDDSALERHPDFAGLRGRELSVTEAGALEHGLSYVELEGDIAIVGNGAGLVMATLDSLAQKGGKPANFCDIGGGATSDMMKIALKTVMSKKNINGLFVNIFGGITRCDEIAKGIVEFLGEGGVSVPMVVRITGTNEDEAKEILHNAEGKNGARAIDVFTFFDEAVAAAAKLSK